MIRPSAVYNLLFEIQKDLLFEYSTLY